MNWVAIQTPLHVTFCKAPFVSEVDACGRAVDAGQRQLGEAVFISPYHTLELHKQLRICL